MEEEGKITPTEESNARKSRLGLHVQYPRNDLAPYFFEELRKYLEATYGTRSEEHTSELQSLRHLVCRLLLEKKNFTTIGMNEPDVAKVNPHPGPIPADG